MKPILQWSDALATGIVDIDLDHQLLFEMVANLQTAPEGEHLENLQSAMQVLIEYTRHHFRKEELLMEQFEYPLVDQHRIEHRELERQVMQHAGLLKQGADREFYENFCNFLYSWLVNHIIKCDMQYRSYINDLVRANEFLCRQHLVEVR